MLLISYNLIALRWHFILLLQKGLDFLASSIGGGIVDEDDMEICVILHDDGLHVLEMPSILDVVVARHYDAEGKFIVFANLILFLVVLPFFLGDLSGVGEAFILFLEPSRRCVCLRSGYAGYRTYPFSTFRGLMGQSMSLGCGRLQLCQGL